VIVADTNLIAYLLIAGDHTPKARTALRKDPQWAVPLLWRSEFNSVLALYMRQQELSYEDAVKLADEAQRLVGNRQYQVPSARVLELVSQSPCSAYDCEYVALAQDLSVSLVTTDAQLIGSFPGVAVSLDEFAAGDGQDAPVPPQ
jgi:predicted nucleic acid-binding protein